MLILKEASTLSKTKNIFQKEHFKKIDGLAGSVSSVGTILEKQPKKISIHYSDFPWDTFGCCMDYFKQVKDSTIDIIISSSIDDKIKNTIASINKQYQSNIKLWHNNGYKYEFDFITGDKQYIKVEKASTLSSGNSWWYYTSKEHSDEEILMLIKQTNKNFKTLLDSSSLEN